MHTATTEIYTLSLHDALPIYKQPWRFLIITNRQVIEALASQVRVAVRRVARHIEPQSVEARSEEHTSELQSRENLVCRLLLEKKKNFPTMKVHWRIGQRMSIS